MFLFFVSPPTLVFVNHVAWLLQDSNAHALGPTFYETYHPQETWTTRSLEHICNLYDRYTVIVAAVNCYLSLASSRKPPFALQPCQGRRDGSRTWRAVGILWVETWQRFDFEDLLRIFQVIFNINTNRVWVGGSEYQQREIRSLKDLDFHKPIIRFLTLQAKTLGQESQSIVRTWQWVYVGYDLWCQSDGRSLGKSLAG